MIVLSRVKLTGVSFCLQGLKSVVMKGKGNRFLQDLKYTNGGEELLKPETESAL